MCCVGDLHHDAHVCCSAHSCSAGYYICWGCLVWVPVVYASPSVFLTTHPGTWGWSTCLILMVVGWIAIGLNYTTDLQRQRFRATNGNCTIWGSKPSTCAGYVYACMHTV